jgi:hypothetical protein
MFISQTYAFLAGLIIGIAISMVVVYIIYEKE